MYFLYVFVMLKTCELSRLGPAHKLEFVFPGKSLPFKQSP